MLLMRNPELLEIPTYLMQVEAFRVVSCQGVVGITAVAHIFYAEGPRGSRLWTLSYLATQPQILAWCETSDYVVRHESVSPTTGWHRSATRCSLSGPCV